MQHKVNFCVSLLQALFSCHYSVLGVIAGWIVRLISGLIT